MFVNTTPCGYVLTDPNLPMKKSRLRSQPPAPRSNGYPYQNRPRQYDGENTIAHGLHVFSTVITIIAPMSTATFMVATVGNFMIKKPSVEKVRVFPQAAQAVLKLIELKQCLKLMRTVPVCLVLIGM